jgi:hypothetical protein
VPEEDQMPQTFDRAVIDNLANVEEIDLETSAGPGKPTRRRTIWVVVVAGRVYVRSVRGAAGRWYRDLVRHPSATIHLAGRALAAHASLAADPATVDRVSQAFATKYAASPYLPPILRTETLPTTLRLDPA